jgi:uncharacterized protein YjbJ (UPF0337 family)
MPEEPTREHAAQEQFIGGAKEIIGKVGEVLPWGNSDLKEEGQEQKKSGEEEYRNSQREDKAKSAGHDLKGGAKEAVGSVFSDDLKNEGREEQDKAAALDEKSKH